MNTRFHFICPASLALLSSIRGRREGKYLETVSVYQGSQIVYQYNALISLRKQTINIRQNLNSRHPISHTPPSNQPNRQKSGIAECRNG